MVVSPNMDFIPEPVWGRLLLRRCSDGSFGIHDPIHWPQLWDSERRPWYATMPRSPMANGWDRPFFEPVDPSRFGPVDNAGGTKLYLITERHGSEIVLQLQAIMEKAEHYWKKPGVTEDLRWLYDGCDKAYGLLSYPATLRDCVRTFSNVQRFYRMMTGYFNWIDVIDEARTGDPRVRKDLMGAFVSQPGHVAHLFRLGIPVWHFRQPLTMYEHMAVLRWVTFTQPSASIPSAHGLFSDGVSWEGLAGHHLQYIDKEAFNQTDVETIPMPRTWQKFGDRIPSVGSSSSARLPSKGMIFIEHLEIIILIWLNRWIRGPWYPWGPRRPIEVRGPRA